MNLKALNITTSLRLFPRFRRDPIATMSELRTRHGDFIELNLGVKKAYLCFHPDLAQEVLSRNADLFPKSRLVFDQIIPLTGPRGLVQIPSQPDAVYRGHRQLTTQALSAEAMDRALPAFARNTLEACQELAACSGLERFVNLSELLTRVVFRNALELVVGESSNDLARELVEPMARLNELCGQGVRGLIPTPRWIPTARARGIRDASRELDDKLMRQILRVRRERRKSSTDLLALLLKSAHAEDLAQIRDHLATYLFAGYETTSTSVLMTLYLLSRHPSPARLVRKEGHLAEGASLENIRSMRATINAYQEALRLFPPSWTLAREAAAQARLGNARIRKGSLVLIGLPQIHRHAGFWSEPDRFLPERFESRLSHPFAFAPFGGGSRICVGARTAMAEACLMLGLLLSRFDFRFSSGFDERAESSMRALITAHPAEPLRAKVQPIPHENEVS